MSTSADAPHGFRGGLHEVFRRRARELPSRTAVEFGGERLTYRELDQFSDRLAGRLTSQGVRVGDVVGLCFPRGVDMVAALLGVLKAGAAYLPIDPDHPAARVHYIVDHSRVDVVVAAPELAGLFDRPDLTLVAYERGAFTGDAPPGWAPAEVSADAPAYVIYTSGTTGEPHGVVVEHGNVDRLFRETEQWFDFSATDVWTLFHSNAFDFSVWELWGALLYGGKAVIVPGATARTPERFHQLVADAGVTVLSQTPTAFRAFAAVDARRRSDLALRHIVLGGEPIDKDVAVAWLARRGESRPRLVNMYGLTETTVHVTYRPLTLDVLGASEHSPIGVPIPDLTIRLLDGAGQPTPRGEIGEIHVGGAGVATGYLNDADLTASRFLGRDAGDGSQERIYRTGDLGVTYDGVEYFFAGRADDQIKLHGYRIDPREIEAVADAQPGLSGSVALRVSPSSGDARLVLFCLHERGAAPAERDAAREAVLARIRESLPPYMCPAECVLLEEHPRNHNGKVDRDSLRELYLAQEPSARPDARPDAGPDARPDPNGGYPEKVRAVWEQVLKRPVGSPDADFFEDGGTSLDLIRIMTETKRQLSVDVDPAAFADGLSFDLYVEHVGKQLASGSRTAAERGPSPAPDDRES
ncbi:amino acid adenylation domain-containing protein [Actinomadura sp. KC216]|uniref:non-ribosomal peptide synthetase n=1 Tax=Actinomadura sp. KC216 TaxID=2530370 RepID=UPI00104A7C9E|nr:non-ribosomal peptide synthetase [Actinomadura sp. KC216]TDB90678.1 amino acid adenylation domain-containing protein [Actinomadura sp. KC216]